MRTMVIALIAAAATVSVPPAATAQTPTPRVGDATPPVTTAAPPSKPVLTPTQQLDLAKQALGAVPQGPRQGEAHDRLAHLRKSFDAMTSAYATGAAAPHGPKDLDQPTPVEWQNKFFAVESDLVLLIGGGSSSSSDGTASTAASEAPAKSGAAPVATAGITPGTTPETSQLVADQGLKPLPEGAKGVDQTLRLKLEQFRTQLELFYDSTTTHDYEVRPGQQ